MNAWAIVGIVCPTFRVPGDQAVRHHLAQAERCGRRGERPDAERIEEVGDGADRELAGIRKAPIGSGGIAGLGARPRLANRFRPAGEVDRRQYAERREQSGDGIHAWDILNGESERQAYPAGPRRGNGGR